MSKCIGLHEYDNNEATAENNDWKTLLRECNENYF